MLHHMESMVRRTQDSICTALEALEGGAQFCTDVWVRPEGGGGTSRVLQNGRVFEKAGVGVSVVRGKLSEEAARSMGGGQGLVGEETLRFSAVGISLVLHPHNPMAPTVHANYRYFERGDGTTPGSWWFGGGADLTPSYLFEEDAKHFHQVHANACQKHDLTFYPRFKAWCDTYFYLPHRGETRGIGGIFFDDLRDRAPLALFDFVSACAAAFLPAYLPILERRWQMPYTEEHKRWQQLRRGRYVEFNLVYDRGTVFGLKTTGRIESILMSLPLTSRWEYNPNPPEEGSQEAELLAVLQKPKAWLSP